MSRRPYLPAAVITDQNAPVARVVPKGAKMRKVGKAVLGYDHKPARISGSPGSVWSFERQRLSEIEALIMSRHGGPCDTDDGEAYLRAALPHLIAGARVPGTPIHRTNALVWANRWTPRILDERTLDWLDELAHEFATRPRLMRADTLAKMLGVTRVEREALGLTTIGAKDWSKKQRLAARKKLHAERQKEARGQAKGYTPRVKAASRSRPWIEAGFKTRRTWERHGKPGHVASSCASSKASETPNVANSCAPIELRSSSARICDTAPVDQEILRSSDCQVRGPAGEAIPPSTTPALPPQPADAVQLSLLASPQPHDELRRALDRWQHGPIPEPVRIGYLAAKRRRAVRQEDVAQAIGISRPQLANALAGTFGLSAPVAERLRTWLLADDRDVVPAGPETHRSSKPHHRRGGRKPADPGPALPALRLFRLVVDQPEAATSSELRAAA